MTIRPAHVHNLVDHSKVKLVTKQSYIYEPIIQGIVGNLKHMLLLVKQMEASGQDASVLKQKALRTQSSLESFGGFGAYTTRIIFKHRSSYSLFFEFDTSTLSSGWSTSEDQDRWQNLGKGIYGN